MENTVLYIFAYYIPYIVYVIHFISVSVFLFF